MTKAITKKANADFVVAIGGKKVIVKEISAVQEVVSTTSTKAAIAKAAQTATTSTAIGAALVAATIADNIANNEDVTPSPDELVNELVDCFRGDYDTRETVRKSYSRTLQAMINAGIPITKDVQNACFIGSMMGKFHVTKEVATAWLTQEGIKERPAEFKRHASSFRQTWKRVLDAMGIKPLSNAGGANNPGKKSNKRAARPGSNAVETDTDDDDDDDGDDDDGDETPATHAARAPVKWERVEDAIVAFKREAAALAQFVSVNLNNASMRGPKASALRYALKAFQSAILAAETASDDVGEEVATIVAPVVAHVTKTLPVITLKRTSRGH